MTKSRQWVADEPRVIPARVSIHHLQLRDLLQPAGVKGRVVFVNRLKIEQVDFNTLKPPSTYCTLDFLPNCLTTACGLLAAGGQHSELALRPLHSPISASHSHATDQAERYPAPWQLRTPTGGSINNAISIQPDTTDASSSSRGAGAAAPEKASVTDIPWARDEPRGPSRRHLLFDNEWPPDDEEHHHDHDPAATYAVNLDWRPRTVDPMRGFRVYQAPPPPPIQGAIKLMVSNNDQSIKSYKLRPPQSIPGAGGRIESGLPGLTKTSTLHFPTAINHSSLSPDQRTLLAVGDTPEVFLYNVSRSGEHVKVATYTASSDAAFSTTWSPDGTKFAVASQDGVVSVWDVRSSRRLAALLTSQSGRADGNGAARVVKFSPHGDMLAFSEHRNYVHVADTVSFEATQKIAVPSVAGGHAHRYDSEYLAPYADDPGPRVSAPSPIPECVLSLPTSLTLSFVAGKLNQRLWPVLGPRRYVLQRRPLSPLALLTHQSPSHAQASISTAQPSVSSRDTACSTRASPGRAPRLSDTKLDAQSTITTATNHGFVSL